MAKEVSIRIKINDNFKDVTVDAESLGKAIDQVSGSAKELSSSFVKFASVSQIAEAASSAFGQLHDVFKGLSDAYATQSIAETRLEQAMSNMMDATAGEIQSIKDLCSAQQQLGVIGDEVQLAAAQELATYLEYSDSLKAIIPVMNDMAAQQFGLGASAESVTQIATMLGKVMNGQTEALSRYGYKFDEAQKQILQFGTEAERAKVLVEVVSESVGGMNEALAQTPAGKMQQIANNFGDWKERLGQAAQSIMPMVSGFNQFAQGVVTVTKLGTAFKALANTSLAAKVQSVGLTMAHRTQSIAAKLLGISEMEAGVATGALRVKIIALQATMTFGLSLAITAVIDLIVRLTGKSRDAADAVEEVDDAYIAFRDTAKNAGGQIEVYKAKLEDIIKHHGNDAQMVEKLNDEYGETMGYYSDAATWYDVLVKKSEAYCRQLGYEAQAKVIASEKADKERELRDIRKQMRAMAESGQIKDSRFGIVRDVDGNARGWGFGGYSDEFIELRKQEAALVKETKELQSEFYECNQELVAAQKELQGALEHTDAAAGWQKMSLSQLTKAIQDQEGVVKSLVGVDEKQADAENKLLKQMQARKAFLEGRYGLGNGSSKDSGDKYNGKTFIENASSYEELGNNIKYYQNQLDKAHPSDVVAIADLNEKINALKQAQTEIKNLNSLLSGDLDDEFMKQFEQELAAEKARIDAEINRLLGHEFDAADKKLNEWRPTGTLGLTSDLEATLTLRLKGAEFAKKQIESLQNLLSVAKGEDRDKVLEAIAYWQKYAKTQTDVKTKSEAVSSSIDTIGNMMGTLSGAIGGSTGEWLTWGSQVLSSIAAIIPQIVSLTTANTAAAASGAAASVASIPYVGWIKAGAAALSVVATLASIPKFADGVLAYGPTLGIFGEYSGAAHNPEVVAPLDRLQHLLGIGTGGDSGTVEFRIRADYIYAMVDRRFKQLARIG